MERSGAEWSVEVEQLWREHVTFWSSKISYYGTVPVSPSPVTGHCQVRHAPTLCANRLHACFIARPPPPSSPCSLPPSLALSSPLPHLPHQFDGYMAAVPSKHDLASFVRSIHVELALAVPAGSINAGIGGGGGLASEAEVAAGGGGAGGGSAEADLTLLPPLLEGVVRAAKLFCAKVEAMQSVEEVRAPCSPQRCALVVALCRHETSQT